MHEFRDQVRLLEQARVLDRNRSLRAQDSQQIFICIGEIPFTFVQRFQHANHFLLGHQGNAQQVLRCELCCLLDIRVVAGVIMCVRSTHRLAVGDDPAGDAAFERHNQSAHHGLVEVRGNLEMELLVGIVI